MEKGELQPNVEELGEIWNVENRGILGRGPLGQVRGW